MKTHEISAGSRLCTAGLAATHPEKIREEVPSCNAFDTRSEPDRAISEFSIQASR